MTAYIVRAQPMGRQDVGGTCNFCYVDGSATGADAQIKSGGGALKGIFVSTAASTPKLTFYDAVAGTATILLDEFVPTAATMYKLPNIAFGTGCYVVVGGTVKFTVFFN